MPFLFIKLNNSSDLPTAPYYIHTIITLWRTFQNEHKLNLKNVQYYNSTSGRWFGGLSKSTGTPSFPHPPSLPSMFSGLVYKDIVFTVASNTYPCNQNMHVLMTTDSQGHCCKSLDGLKCPPSTVLY